MPSRSKDHVQPTALGGVVVEHGADRQAALHGAGDPAEHGQADRADAVLVARDVRPRIEPGSAEGQLEHRRAGGLGDLSHHGRAAVGRPRLLHHDHVGIEAAQDRVEVVGLAHPVVPRLQSRRGS